MTERVGKLEIICPRCKGNGYYWVEIGYGDERNERSEECEVCDGSGKLTFNIYPSDIGAAGFNNSR